MGEGNHTPGPWALCHHLQSPEKDASCGCGYRGGIWGSDGEHIVCEMGSTETAGQEGMSPPRYERPVELANARLIAAAPEMLGMLYRLRDYANEQEISSADFPRIEVEAIIDKAEGRS